jgi:hypothetical protein
MEDACDSEGNVYVDPVAMFMKHRSFAELQRFEWCLKSRHVQTYRRRGVVLYLFIAVQG